MNKSLKRLKLELQANVSSVKMDLGGENYGYFGLILADNEYTLIPNTQLFTLLHYPSPLVILANSILIQVLELKDEH